MKLFDLADLGPRQSVRFAVGPGWEGFAVRDVSGAVRAY